MSGVSLVNMGVDLKVAYQSQTKRDRVILAGISQGRLGYRPSGSWADDKLDIVRGPGV